MTDKVTLYIGLNDKDTKRQEISTIEAYKIVQNIVMSMADGCTIYEADGVYRHNDGTITIEKSLKVELFGLFEGVVMSIIALLKKALNQESIIKQVEIVNTVFV